jgi:hypothetical protein
VLAAPGRTTILEKMATYQSCYELERTGLNHAAAALERLRASITRDQQARARRPARDPRPPPRKTREAEAPDWWWLK